MFGPFELSQHCLAVHFLVFQSAGEGGHSLVTPQMQGMGRQQDRFPGRSLGIQPGLDLDDVERGDGLQKRPGPGVIDVVHRRVMPGQPVVEALPGLDELRGGVPELRLSGDRQRRLVEQEAEIIQYHPACGHDAVPEPAEILRRDPSLVQLILHLPDDRAKFVHLAVVRDRGLTRPELDRLALSVVAQRSFKRRIPRFEEPAPVIGPAEELDPGQEFAVDVEFEPAFFAIDGILAAGRVLVVLNRIVQGLAHLVGDVLQRLVITVEQRRAALS